MLDLNHVRTFLAIIDTKGVRSAARALNLAPSTVVDHIKQLETDLASPLILRQRGRMAPTALGVRFIPFARALISTASRARELMRSRSLRVAASSNVGTYLLQKPLAAFRRATAIDIEVWIGPNLEVAERLERGEADLAAMEWWDGRRGFIACRWLSEPLTVIVGPEHAWAGRAAISADDLVGERLLGGEPGTGTGRLLRETLGPVADRLHTVSGFGNTEAVKRAVRAGLGASIVLRAAVADEVAAGQLIAVPIHGVAIDKDIQLVVPDGLPETAPARAFILSAAGPASAPTV